MQIFPKQNVELKIMQVLNVLMLQQWRSKVPKSGGAHRHVIFVPSVKNQYKRVVFGCMVI